MTSRRDDPLLRIQRLWNWLPAFRAVAETEHLPTAAQRIGVSASAFNGISPSAMFKRLLRHIVLSGKVSSVDICELNPKFDVDYRTSRLAAAFVFDIVQAADINAEYPG